MCVERSNHPYTNGKRGDAFVDGCCVCCRPEFRVKVRVKAADGKKQTEVEAARCRWPNGPNDWNRLPEEGAEVGLRIQERRKVLATGDRRVRGFKGTKEGGTKLRKVE